MASDLYGNSVGEFTLFDAADAEMTISAGSGAQGGTASCTNVSVSYNVPIQPVATFGKDVVFAKGTPQGTFSCASLAGSTDFAMAADKCEAATITVDFGAGNCEIKRTNKENLRSRGVVLTLHNAVFSQFQIQGTAQDAFFTENVGGFFHYLERRRD